MPHAYTSAPSSSPAPSFAATAKLPDTGIIYSGTFNLIPVDVVDIPTNEQQDIEVGAAGDDVAARDPIDLDLENSKVTVFI